MDDTYKKYSVPGFETRTVVLKDKYCTDQVTWQRDGCRLDALFDVDGIYLFVSGRRSDWPKFDNLDDAVAFVKDNLDEVVEIMNNHPNATIGFSMIDAKDGPVLYLDMDGYGSNAHNERIRFKAEHEYLKRLAELQRDIQNIYEPQLVENKPIDDEDEMDVINDVYDELKEAHKYTLEMGNTYYT